MKRGQDLSARFPGLYLVHQNLPGKKVVSVRHEEAILFIPLQGEIHLKLDECEYRFGLGSMLCLAPGTLHSFASSGSSGERLIAMIDPRLWKSVGPSVPAAALIPLHQLVKEILFYLLIHRGSKHAGALVQVFAGTLAECLEAQGQDGSLSAEHWISKARDPRLQKLLHWMQAHLDERFEISEAAKRSGLSLRSLNRLAMKELGRAPKQILIDLRIARARELLANGRKSVAEVAAEVGYDSLSAFIQAFRTRTGQLPSEFARFGANP